MAPSYTEIYCSVGKIHRLLESVIQSAVSGLALTVAQFQLLDAVASGKATSPAKCGASINLTPSAMTNILDNLESRELIARTREQRDRRFVTIVLLPDGDSLYQRAAQAAAKSWEAAAASLSREDSALFLKFATVEQA